MEKVCSAMLEEEIKQKQERQQELSSQIEQRKNEFDNEKDVEKRDAMLTDVENMKNEIESINKELEELSEREKTLKEQENRMSLIGNVETKTVQLRNDKYATAEYRDAYVDWLKTGKMSPILETEERAGVTSTVAAPIVPTILQDYIETAWSEYGQVANLCDVITVKGYFSVPYEKSATGAAVHAEGAAAPSEETLTFDSIVLQPQMIKKWISLTDEVIALTGDMFLKYIADELVYQIYKKLDELIVSGTLSSGKGVKGIINDTNATSVTSSLTFNAINTALAELNKFDNITVVMNPRTFFKNVLGLADTTGRPIYTVAADNTGKPKYYINGLPVVFSEAVTAYDDAVTAKSTAWAIVGDFKAYKLNLPEGKAVQSLYDPYTSATQDKVIEVGRLFAAGAITKQKRLAKLVTSA